MGKVDEAQLNGRKRSVWPQIDLLVLFPIIDTLEHDMRSDPFVGTSFGKDALTGIGIEEGVEEASHDWGEVFRDRGHFVLIS